MTKNQGGGTGIGGLELLSTFVTACLTAAMSHGCKLLGERTVRKRSPSAGRGEEIIDFAGGNL